MNIQKKLQYSTAGERWKLYEKWLLAVYLFSKGSFFLRQLGKKVGFDADAHIEMLRLITWENPDTDIFNSFYGYHPPLGFLFARTFHLLGFSTTVSVQLVSFICSILIFVLLRDILQYLRQLSEPWGVIFLYIFAAIPLQIYMSMSVNLDVIILALAVCVLNCSIRLFWEDPGTKLDSEERKNERVTLYLTMASALCSALLVKFSGLLVIGIPALTALVRPSLRYTISMFSRGAVIAGLVLVTVIPYYANRYYFETGRMFPSNEDWMMEEPLMQLRAKRDTDKLKFITDLLRPTSVHAEKGITYRDYETIRLWDTWRDFWIKEDFLGKTSVTARVIGTWYMRLIPFLMWPAIIFLALTKDKKLPVYRFGVIVLGFSFVQIAALIFYMYKNPLSFWGPSKGLYIAPVCLGVAYLLALTLSSYTQLSHKSIVKNIRYIELGLLTGLTLFVAINHGVPLYF